MADQNHVDNEGEDRKNSMAFLIFDEITDKLHHNANLAGKLEDSRTPTPDSVIFEFADGRNVTVRIEIDPPRS